MTDDITISSLQEQLRTVISQRDAATEQWQSFVRRWRDKEKECEELAAQVKRWEDKEVERASCCWENEKRADAAEKALAEERARREAAEWALNHERTLSKEWYDEARKAQDRAEAADAALKTAEAAAVTNERAYRALEGDCKAAEAKLRRIEKLADGWGRGQWDSEKLFRVADALDAILLDNTSAPVAGEPRGDLAEKFRPGLDRASNPSLFVGEPQQAAPEMFELIPHGRLPCDDHELRALRNFRRHPWCKAIPLGDDDHPVCTLMPGHDGPHVATGSEYVLARWPAAPAPQQQAAPDCQCDSSVPWLGHLDGCPSAAPSPSEETPAPRETLPFGGKVADALKTIRATLDGGFFPFSIRGHAEAERIYRGSLQFEESMLLRIQAAEKRSGELEEALRELVDAFWHDDSADFECDGPFDLAFERARAVLADLPESSGQEGGNG